MSSKVPEVASTVLPRTARTLLPRFQSLLSKWEVDEARAPGTPDPARYLRTYTQTKVETDKVTYEIALAELRAAERLADPSFFSNYSSVPREYSISTLSYTQLRTVNVEPNSPVAKGIIRRVVIRDIWEDRKGQARSGLFIVFGLVIVLSFVKLSNEIRRSRAVQLNS